MTQPPTAILHSPRRLQVVVARATDLKPTSSKGAPEAEHDTEEVMAFIELQAGGRAYASPVVAQGSAPEIGFPFYVPLADVPEASGNRPLRFTVRNFLAKQQPQVRACFLDLAPHAPVSIVEQR